jgi:hypothetical protein
MVVDSNIGPLNAFAGGSSMLYVRNFDPSTETLTLCGDAYELKHVIIAIETLLLATEHKLREGREGPMAQ